MQAERTVAAPSPTWVMSSGRGARNSCIVSGLLNSSAWRAAIAAPASLVLLAAMLLALC